MSSAQIVSATAIHNKAAAAGLASLGLASPVSYPGAVSIVRQCLNIHTFLISMFYVILPPNFLLSFPLMFCVEIRFPI
jgi:hypothetical protein